MNMSRFVSSLGIAAAIAFFVLVMALANVTTQLPRPAPDTSISSSTATVPDLRLPPITIPSLSPSTETQPTVVQKKETSAASAPTAAPPVSAPAIVPLPIPAPPSSEALDASAATVRAALVNILCYVPSGVGLHSISGSGVFIDSKGIILTNAHIAQYFLLADKNADCTIRMGSPAVNTYKAALMYISPAWLHANEKVLTQTLPSGTGEHDFALLAVTKSATNKPLPNTYPSIPLATNPPGTGTPVVIATYGAQFIESSQVQYNLSPTVVFGSVKDIFTFAMNTIDVLALGGSAAAQEGSSGGGVANASGYLVGTITTSTVTGTTDTRSLDAITASYIRADYASDTGEPLDLLLARDPATAAADFAPQIPVLEKIITVGLP